MTIKEWLLGKERVVTCIFVGGPANGRRHDVPSGVSRVNLHVDGFPLMTIALYTRTDFNQFTFVTPGIRGTGRFN